MSLKTFLLEDYYDKYEFSTPYLLSQSDCESMTVEALLAMVPGSREKFMESWLGYTEARGSLPLREKIAALYEKMGSEQILIHAGAEEAIFNFMQIFLNPGDHMIYMAPAYQSLYEVGISLKCEASPWQLQQGDGGWTLDMGELENLIQPNTKLIVINTPHNPTGYSLSTGELEAIISLARENNIFVFCDQVYKGLEWDDQPHPWLCDRYENSLSLGVMSKAYGLAGLRIGWIATQNAQVYEQMLKYKYYTTICSSGPSEFLSMVALEQGEAIIQRNLEIIQGNLAYAEGFFRKYDQYFLNNRPAAGPIGFHQLKIPGEINAFCQDLIQKKGVLLLPGDVYEVKGDYFRMGYGRKNFKESLDRLAAYLEEAFPGF